MRCVEVSGTCCTVECVCVPGFHVSDAHNNDANERARSFANIGPNISECESCLEADL